MYQLTYQSTAIIGIQKEQLEQILETAQARNSGEGISGCLVYYRDRFVQILEGDKKVVRRLYSQIKLDDRHHSVTLLWKGDVLERCFPHWNMAFYHQSYSPNPDESEERFIKNMSLLSDLSSKPTGSVLSFWATVRKFLNGYTKTNFI